MENKRIGLNKNKPSNQIDRNLAKIDMEYDFAARKQIKQKQQQAIHNIKEVKSTEFTRISKLFTNGLVTVKALAVINGSVVDISWPFHSRTEADKCVDQLYDYPVKMAQRYLMLLRK